MATTTTARMNVIADEREAEGFYVQAIAIRQLAEQRDKLLAALEEARSGLVAYCAGATAETIAKVDTAIATAINP